MDRTREGTGYGINPLQPTQIEAWFRLRQIQPQAWHLDAIETLDATRMRLYSEKREEENSGETVVNDVPMTKGLFRSLFSSKQ